MQSDSRARKASELKQDVRVYQDHDHEFTAVRGDRELTFRFDSANEAAGFSGWAQGRDVLPPHALLDQLRAAGFVVAPIERQHFPPAYLDRHERTLSYLACFETQSESASAMLQKLHSARVTVIGLGGVGSWIAWTLLMMGVGTVVGVDGDRIHASNLNRTLVYSPAHLGRLKSVAFQEASRAYFPDQRFVGHQRWISSPSDVAELSSESSHVVSAADTPHRKIREWVRQGAAAVDARVVETMGGRIGPIRGPGAVPYDQPVTPPTSWRASISAEARGPGVPVFHPLADAVGICQALFSELTGTGDAPLRRGFIQKSSTVSLATFCPMEGAAP
jgi:hypothetical protein